MSQEYTLDIGGQKFKVSVQRLDEGGLLIVNVGDQSFTLKPSENEDGTWTVNDTQTDHVLKVLNRSGNTVEIEIDGVAKNVKWGRTKKETGASIVRSSVRGDKKKEGGVYPPMPGKITEVRVKVGDEVKTGDTVCILEAMKMFNELKASRDGVVKEVNIQPGSSVTPDDLLVLIE